MSGPRPGSSRGALAPLGALVALGLLAGVMIGREATRVDVVQVGAPDGVAAKLAIGASATRVVEAGSSNRRYAFLLMQPDRVTPVRWNPCDPVTFKVATNGLVPSSEIEMVRAAFATVSVALGGVQFAYQGTTSVIPDTVDDSARAQTDVVFAFAQPGVGPRRSALLTGWEAGRGGFAAWTPTRADGLVVERPTHGSVVVDAGKWAAMNRHDRTLLFLHEIGHVVGLDHPTVRDQVMSSGSYDLPLRFQSGDRAGLARLGRQAGCLP